MVVRNVEIIMYYRPLCPVCPRLREVVEEVLVETGLYRKIPFTEQIIAPPFIYDNPFARIAKEEKITVVNIGRGRAERIPVRDVADYAHLHVETPILEVRVYQDTRTDRFIFLGFPMHTSPEVEERLVGEFKINLASLLAIFARGIRLEY